MFMKRLFVTLAMAVAIGSSADAVPALRVRQTITLADGSTVTAVLQGDEHMHWFETADGRRFVGNGEGRYVPADMVAMKRSAEARRSAIAAERAKRLGRVRSTFCPAGGALRAEIGGDHITYTGKKRGLVILVDFPDQHFADGHDNAYYQRVCNETDFSSDEGYVGSVRDYFYAQSNGLFELTFDIVGPYTAKEKLAYYGGNGANGQGGDINVRRLIKEACDFAADRVNFADYDWDGDGEADQVFVLYSGLSEAAGGAPETIWPHEWRLSSDDTVGKQVYSTGAVDTYGCANELGRKVDKNNEYTDETYPAGVGTFCHEFSHCLGFADMYDYNGQRNYGMCVWDVMDQGAYLGDGMVPCNYTAFERIYAGWVEPIVLDSPASVERMQAVSDFGRPFIIYNDGCADEYYLLDNRMRTGWDAKLYGEGLLVTHVDYDASAWASNAVNYSGYGHQRCTIFHADNKEGRSTLQDLRGDPYPYVNGAIVNDELSSESLPTATLYNANTDGRKFMNKPITAITRADDGTIAFDFMGGDDNNILDNATTATAITTVNMPARSDNGIFSVDGRYLGTDLTKLGKGIYIVRGKKVVK